MGEPLGDDEYMADIHRGSTGFGFNIKGTVQEGGVMQAINGRLFPPLQYVSFVDKGTKTSMLYVLTCLHVAVGAAYSGGLRQYDRLLEINGEDVQGAKHAHVVDLVIQSGDHLRIRVLRVDEAEALRLQRLEDAAEGKEKPAAAVPTAVCSEHVNIRLPLTRYAAWCAYMCHQIHADDRRL